MSGEVKPLEFILMAAAAFGQAAAKISSRYWPNSSARASALPNGAVAAFDKTKNSPAIKDLTSEVLKVVGTPTSVGNSHEMCLCMKGRLWLEPADVSASVRLASFYSM